MSSSDNEGKKPATYAEIEALPPHKVGEIVGGSLYVSPRPAMPHATASSGLGALLGSAFQFGLGGPGGWWILFEPELHLGGDVLVPDLAGWRRERMPTVPNVAFVELAPDWICEVISPSTATRDRLHKLPAYAREGVSHAWLVDPLARSLEVFRLEEGRWVFLGGGEGEDKARMEPFEAFELDLSLLWIPEESEAK
jgi:Uma2 family endonuclease